MRARHSLLAVTAAALLCAGCGAAAAHTASGTHSSAARTKTATTAPLPPLKALAISPAAHLGGDAAITVSFNRSVGAASGLPTIAPSTPGNWARTGNRLVFTPAQAYPPYEQLTVSVPSGLGGPLVAHLSAPAGSVVRAQQILCRLGYLPLSFNGPTPPDATAEAAAVYSPPAGTFAWRWAQVPPTLRNRWLPGAYGQMTRGALIAFQHVSGLPMDGQLGPVTWHALLAADQADARDPNPYSYIWADLTVPEHLYVWVNGQTVIDSPVNGGVRGAPTPIGTWPIYLRFTSTTMQGTNPNGTHYDDHGVPWVNYYDGGAAVHGFPRASYGWPQSVGCLELPIPTAARVFQLVNYGTLVTAYGNAFG